MGTRAYYKSFEEYCKKNPERNKLCDIVCEASIKLRGYVESDVGIMRDNQDVPKFIRDVNAAHERAGGNRMFFGLSA